MSEKVLTANHLLSGEVVFLAEGELWTPDINEALVAESADDEAWFAQAGGRAVAAQTVVEPYLIDVDRRAGAVVPVRYREKLRSRGPSVRLDLGKQAA